MLGEFWLFWYNAVRTEGFKTSLECQLPIAFFHYCLKEGWSQSNWSGGLQDSQCSVLFSQKVFFVILRHYTSAMCNCMWPAHVIVSKSQNPRPPLPVSCRPFTR